VPGKKGTTCVGKKKKKASTAKKKKRRGPPGSLVEGPSKKRFTEKRDTEQRESSSSHPSGGGEKKKDPALSRGGGEGKEKISRPKFFFLRGKTGVFSLAKGDTGTWRQTPNRLLYRRKPTRLSPLRGRNISEKGTMG